MGKDVDVKDAEDGDGNLESKELGDEEVPSPPPFYDICNPEEQLRANVALLEKAVRSKDTRLLLGKLQRQTALVRKDKPTLMSAYYFAEKILPSDSQAQESIHKSLRPFTDEWMDPKVNHRGQTPPRYSLGPDIQSVMPETEAYVYLVTIILLVDRKHFKEARALANEAIKRLNHCNQRTLDSIAAQIYFYYSWANEKAGTLAAIRSELLRLYQTSVQRHDDYGQEMLLNLLLRNYLHYNLYDQAEKLRSKAQRPEVSCSNSQLCRYLYYLGRIRAIQLDYTDAKECLQQAFRKAPTLAIGFRVTAAKWLALVRLLLGEIPELGQLTAVGMKEALRPYFDLTQAVKSGDLAAFGTVAEKFKAVFIADKTHNLIVRLRHNVIRAGLRRINLAYSRIALKDVAQKLGLASVEDTECIVAKAIRNGGIDATISHEEGYMSSRKVADIYSTNEPRDEFHKRTAFCLDIHNEAVKAMRFGSPANEEMLEVADILLELRWS